jgi:hypothetical protein
VDHPDPKTRLNSFRSQQKWIILIHCLFEQSPARMTVIVARSAGTPPENRGAPHGPDGVAPSRGLSGESARIAATPRRAALGRAAPFDPGRKPPNLLH